MYNENKQVDYNQKFHADLVWGELGEKVIAKWLEKYKGFTETIFNPNKNNEYDFSSVLNSKRISYEVKTDRYEHFKKVTTNNIFIETTCSGKPSGIHTTKSDVFVYFFPDFEEAFLIKTKDLKKLIQTVPFRRSSRAGDKGKVTGFLINKKDLRNEFNIIKVKKISVWN